MEFVPHVIDGQETESISGERFASVDPWTREPWAEVALGGADALLANLATGPVRAARRAFDEGPWPKMGHAQRGALLHRFADPIMAGWPWKPACRPASSTSCTATARIQPAPR